MVKTPIDTAEDTAAPDIAANLLAFGHTLGSQNRSALTVKSYSAAIRLLDDFLAGRGMPRAVASIRREHIEAFIEDQLERLRPASAANRYRSLQQFFKWLVEEGEIQTSPMARMHPPTIPETPPPVLREAALAALKKATAGVDFEARRDRAIIDLFHDSGIRLAEMAGLKLADIDLNVRTVWVTGKGDRPRQVPFDFETARALDRYVRKSRSQHPHAGLPWLWIGKKGRLTSTGISQVVKRRGLEAGITGLHPHLFRHTFAHEMSRDGMQETELMRLAGWKSRLMVGRYGASAADERALASYRALKDRTR